MKRTTKIAIAIAAVFALCLGLVGCGGGDGADYTKNFTGDWKLSGMTENGEAMSGDDIAFMESFGMTVTLTLNEDGTGSLVMFDEAMDVSWKPKSATELDVTIDGDTTTGKLADDTITLEAGGDSMSFVRVGRCGQIADCATPIEYRIEGACGRMAASSFRFAWTHIAAGSFFGRRRCAAAYGGDFGSSGSCRGLILGQRGVMG